MEYGKRARLWTKTYRSIAAPEFSLDAHLAHLLVEDGYTFATLARDEPVREYDFQPIEP